MNKAHNNNTQKTRILFSLAVHEAKDVVVDQIRNIQYYTKDAIIILHANAEFYNDITDLPELFPNVYLNPTALHTGYMDGSLFFVHYSNLLYSRDKDFDYFVMLGSNELFIRHGVENHIKQFDHSAAFKRILTNRWCPHYSSFLDDPNMVFMDLNHIYKIPPEGSFYNREAVTSFLMNDGLANYYKEKTHLYTKPIDPKWLKKAKKILSKLKIYNTALYDRPHYALEEIIYPSLANCQAKIGPKTCFINWEDNLIVTISDIDEIRNEPNSNFYSVKRVDRIYDEPIRSYIRQTSQQYKIIT